MEIAAETLLAMGFWEIRAFPGCFDGPSLGWKCSFSVCVLGACGIERSKPPSLARTWETPSFIPSPAAYLLCDLDK